MVRGGSTRHHRAASSSSGAPAEPGRPAGSKAKPGESRWQPNLAVAGEPSLPPRGLPFSSFHYPFVCVQMGRYQKISRDRRSVVQVNRWY